MNNKIKNVITSNLIGAVSLLAVAGAQASTVFVDPANLNVAPGSTFNATIQADFTGDPDGPPVEGGFLLTWNTSILTLVGGGQSGDITAAYDAFEAAHVDPFTGPISPFGSVLVADIPGGSLDFTFSNCGFEGLSVVCDPVGTSFSAFDLIFEVASDADGVTTADLTIGTVGSQWTGADGVTVLNPNFVGATINVNAVPIPPAVWLFGSGLVGLVGVARRRR